MLRASVRHWLPGRTPFLAVGVLVLGGFFLSLTPGSAQNTKVQPKEPAKAPADPKAPPANPFKGDPTPHKTIKLEIHKGSSPDVAEAVCLINEKLADGWEENKVTPSR